MFIFNITYLENLRTPREKAPTFVVQYFLKETLLLI